MCISLTTALVVGGIAAAAGGGAAAIVGAASGKDKGPDMPALPVSPMVQAAETAGDQRRSLNQRRASGSDNVLTSPLGVAEAAPTKKTLLG